MFIPTLLWHFHRFDASPKHVKTGTPACRASPRPIPQEAPVLRHRRVEAREVSAVLREQTRLALRGGRGLQGRAGDGLRQQGHRGEGRG